MKQNNLKQIIAESKLIRRLENTFPLDDIDRREENIKNQGLSIFIDAAMSNQQNVMHFILARIGNPILRVEFIDQTKSILKDYKGDKSDNFKAGFKFLSKHKAKILDRALETSFQENKQLDKIFQTSPSPATRSYLYTSYVPDEQDESTNSQLSEITKTMDVESVKLLNSARNSLASSSAAKPNTTNAIEGSKSDTSLQSNLRSNNNSSKGRVL